MNDALDVTGDSDRMCADFPAQQKVHEDFAARQPPPEIEAMQQMLSEAFHREMILRAEIVRLRRSATQAMAMQREE